MTQEQNTRAIGVFLSRLDVQLALEELKSFDFPMDKVSAIALDLDRSDLIPSLESSPAKDPGKKGAALGAVTGGTLGGITGLLVGLGSLTIPGVGPIMLAGATATAIATAVAGSAMGASAGSFLGRLVALGIPEEDAKVYSDRVLNGFYLIIVDGTRTEIIRAQAILSRLGIKDWNSYALPNLKPSL